MRRAVAFGLLTLGLLLLTAAAAPGQPVTPPTSAPSSSTSSTTTSTLPRAATAGGGGSSGLPTLGEGFPWITVGAVILVGGLIGGQLRRAARR
jgi:hypothetical protein